MKSTRICDYKSECEIYILSPPPYSSVVSGDSRGEKNMKCAKKKKASFVSCFFFLDFWTFKFLYFGNTQQTKTHQNGCARKWTNYISKKLS